MKSNFIYATAMLLQCSLWSQPVVNSSNVASNFQADFYYSLATEFFPGPAGANQTWDFSHIDGDFLGSDTALPVAGSPFAANFPTANYLYKFSGPLTEGDLYFYHNLTAEKFEIITLGYNGSTGDNFSPNPKTYVTFPYVYNTVFTDTFQSTTDSGPTTFTATYDGYGTLIMSFGTFTNVVRQKVVSNGVTNYNWFNVSPFYPILQTVFEENMLGIVQDQTQLDITDNETAGSAAVYPNPVRDVVHINLASQISGPVTISVYNLAGQMVYNQKSDLDESHVSADIQHLSPGLYFVEISTLESSPPFISKIVKE